MRSNSIGKTTKIEGCGVTNMVFYVLANKGLLPNTILSKSYKYCDLYFGASNGIDLYFINKSNFRLGLLSVRHETLNTFFNALVCRFDRNIHFALGIIDSLAAFILGLYVSGINIKIGPISLNFIEKETTIYLTPLSHFCFSDPFLNITFIEL